MSAEAIVLEVPLRSFAEMVAEILRNEGVDAYALGVSFLGSAYLVEAALMNAEGVAWRVTVPAEQEARAREILAELEEAGKLVEVGGLEDISEE